MPSLTDTHTTLQQCLDRTEDDQVRVPRGVLSDAVRYLERSDPTRMAPLTPRQHEVLMYIAASIRERGYAPTHDELCIQHGWRSLATAAEMVSELVRKGWLIRLETAARGLKLTPALEDAPC